MRKFNMFKWIVLVHLLLFTFNGFDGITSLKVSANHIHGRSLENNLRLLSDLDDDKNIPMESLRDLSPSKLIGDKSTANNKDGNSIDDVQNEGSGDARSTPMIGNSV